jgi:hypothetical protein
VDVATAAFVLIPLAAAHGCLRRVRGGLRFQLLLDVALLMVPGRFLLSGAHLLPGLPPRVAWGAPARVSGSGELEDLPLQLAPAWEEVRRLVAGGEPPWISDRIGGGTPLVGNGLSGVPFPLNLPVWILGAERGSDVMAVWKLELAGLGAFLLLRRLGLKPAAGATGALAFALSPYFLSHLIFPLGWVVAATPWAGWALLGALRGRGGDGAFLALLLGSLAGWSTHPEAAAFLLLGCAGGGLVLAWGRARRLSRLAVPLLLAVLVSAAGAIPTVLTIRGSSKFASARSQETITAGERRLLAGLLVVPWREGHPADGTFPHLFPLTGLQLGAGSVALAAVFFSGVRRRHRRAALASWTVALGAGLLFFQAPGLTPLLRRVPVLDVMIWFRSGFLVAFGIAVGGALALDAWLARPRRVRAAVGAAAVLLACAALLATAGGVLPREAAAAPLFAGLAGFVAALGAGPVAAAFPVLIMAEEVLSGWRIVPAATTWTAPPPLVAELQKRAAGRDDRVLGLSDALAPNLAARWGLSDLRDNDPVRSVALRNLHEAFGSAGAALPGPLERPWPGLAGAWGVRWLAAPPLPAGDSRAEGWREVFRTTDGMVYENPRVLPFLRWASAVTALPKPWDRGADGADFRTTAYADAPLDLGGDARVEPLARHPADFRARFFVKGRVLALLHVPHAVGWRATVDGLPAPIVLANVAAMGVLVGEGVHEVGWHYSPPGLLAGAALTLAGLAGCAVLARPRWRRIRRIGRVG